MSYNTLDNEVASGIEYYINDLNTRFTNLLFTNVENYKAKYLGLARLDINGRPMSHSEDYEYLDGMLDDEYHLVSSFIELADRKELDAGFESTIDLLVSVNMDRFTGYREEGIIKAVQDVMRVTSFKFETVTRDFNALKGIVNQVPDSLYPHFVFRIKSKLTGIYKVN